MSSTFSRLFLYIFFFSGLEFIDQLLAAVKYSYHVQRQRCVPERFMHNCHDHQYHTITIFFLLFLFSSFSSFPPLFLFFLFFFLSVSRVAACGIGSRCVRAGQSQTNNRLRPLPVTGRIRMAGLFMSWHRVVGKHSRVTPACTDTLMSEIKQSTVLHAQFKVAFAIC